MTFYYAAYSERSLEEICGELQASLALPSFVIRRELPHLYAESGDWSWASLSGDVLSLRLTRTDDVLAADAWMPGQPGGVNTLIALTAEGSPPAFAAHLDTACGSEARRYAEVDTVWTVSQEADQHYRWARQSGSLVGLAIFTLRLSPSPTAFPVRFLDGVDYEKIARDYHVEPDPARVYAAAVAAGVDACIQRWTLSGRPVGWLQVALTELVIHPTDARTRYFRQGGALALEQALERRAVAISPAGKRSVGGA